MEKTQQIFGKNLKDLKKTNKLKWNYIADAIGVSEAALHNYVNGRIPSAEILIKLSRLFNVSVDWLLGRDIQIKEEEKTTLSVDEAIDIAVKGIVGDELDSGSREDIRLIVKGEIIKQYRQMKTIDELHKHIGEMHEQVSETEASLKDAEYYEAEKKKLQRQERARRAKKIKRVDAIQFLKDCEIMHGEINDAAQHRFEKELFKGRAEITQGELEDYIKAEKKKMEECEEEGKRKFGA